MFRTLLAISVSALFALSLAPVNALTTTAADTGYQAAAGTVDYQYCPGEADVVPVTATNNQDGTWTFYMSDIGNPCDPWYDTNVFIASGSPKVGFHGPGISSSAWSVSGGGFSGYITMLGVLGPQYPISGNIAGSIA